MLKRKLCEAKITWEFSCKGPLLIKDGRFESPGKKEGYPDTLFISRLTDKELRHLSQKCNAEPPKTSFYVPGTSLRGPVRALAERIIRSLVTNPTSPTTACDPFEQDSGKELLSCSKRYERENIGSRKYAGACPACKLFGYAGLASRVQFTDADIQPPYASLYRDMVGIDRFTGGAYHEITKGGEKKGALMRFHVLENTSFTSTVTVTNFELWQLGLLAYVFRDFEEGLIPIGFGKTKGFGQVKGEVKEIFLSFPRTLARAGRLEHLGSLATPEEKSTYGLDNREAPEFDGLQSENSGLSLYESLKVTNISELWANAAPAFNEYLNGLNQVPDTTLQPSGETP